MVIAKSSADLMVAPAFVVLFQGFDGGSAYFAIRALVYGDNVMHSVFETKGEDYR
jgi:hypothetical protein